MRREKVTRDIVAERLREHNERGFHVDSRVVREIDQPGDLSLLTLETEGEFDSLVWQAVDDTRPLTPSGQPRSLRDCASRVASFRWSFEALVQAGYPWFQKCIDIDRAFDIEKVGWIVVTPLVASELRETLMAPTTFMTAFTRASS